jgi:SAM-dependent methyltransferase
MERLDRRPTVVLDPFCGKGTALLAARIVGSEAYGIDVAPEAVICARAKLADATLESAQQYVASLRLGRPSIGTVPSSVATFFHPSTLQQIISIHRRLRVSLENDSGAALDAARIVEAALLGILHGHASHSLSISSSHAFAMSPAYVRKYASEHHLRAPLRDVKACLQAKLRRCLARPLPPPVPAAVVRGRAQNALTLLAALRGRVDCVLTSPPYLASHTYAKDNWLRHWLLGYDYRDLSNDYLQTGSVAKYAAEMRPVIESIEQLLRPGGRLICIIGHGRRGHGTASTANDVNMKLLFKKLIEEHSGTLRLDNIVTERVLSSKRYYHALSGTNGHNAESRNEYVLIATKRG